VMALVRSEERGPRAPLLSSNRWYRLVRHLTGYIFLAPMIVILGLFVVFPIVYVLYLSLFRVDLLAGTWTFAGLDNYRYLLEDMKVRYALRNTITYAAVVVPTQTVIALLLAAILNTGIRGREFFRVAYFVPTVTSSAVLTLIFMWMYSKTGLLNAILNRLGLPGYDWLNDPRIALVSIMIMNIWSTVGQYMVIYLAALQDIPRTLYEAARVDGASWWQQLRYVTLPMLKPATNFVVIMGIIGTLQLFDQAFIFSDGSGGPNNATLTMVLYIYQNAFRNFDFGYAGALSFVLAVVIMIGTVLYRALAGEGRYR